MAKLVSLAFGLALWSLSGAAGVACAADKIDVTGAWDFEVEIAGTQGAPSFTFKQDGEKLTGKYKGQFGDADVAGTVKGADIEFAFELLGGSKVKYTGTIEKDGTMKGKANYDDQASGTWKAKRKSADSK